MPSHEFIGVILGAMRGVAAAHRAGVIHRDIHPGNIFLAREPPHRQLVPKVLDFGISKVRDVQQGSLTNSGVAMGTPHYMSYEQLRNARDIDARTDIYTFGVILYQGLTNQLPFDSGALADFLLKLSTSSPVPPKQLYSGIPTALDRVILWAMERDRDSRIPTLDAFIEELEPFASEQAFRPSMTDTHRGTLRIVPPPAAETAPARASEHPTAAPSAVTAELPIAIASRAPAAPAATASPPRKLRPLPAILVAGCTLAVLSAGTHLLGRCAPAQERAQKSPSVAAPAAHPLPVVAAPEPLPRPAPTVPAPAVPAPAAEVAELFTLQREPAAAPPAPPEPVEPPPTMLEPPIRARPQPVPIASRPAPVHATVPRRFRAGEARLKDF